MDWESANLPESWRRFKQHVKLMFTGPLKAVSEEDKCSYLLLWVGDKGRDIFNTWTLTEDQAKLLETYYVKFEEYVTPKANPIFARYKFQERMQGSGEPFERFVTDLKLLVKDCGYADSDQMVRDRIVFATNSHKVREKLLSHGATLDLIKAIDIARSHELAQGQMKVEHQLTLIATTYTLWAAPRCTERRQNTALTTVKGGNIQAVETVEENNTVTVRTAQLGADNATSANVLIISPRYADLSSNAGPSQCMQ